MSLSLPCAAPEARLWHPVCEAAALLDQPRAARLLGQDLVLWRDASGASHAFIDQCPHRGARLSLGRVCEGRLTCPYHGWAFEGDGRCARIPAVPGFTPPASHAARAVAAREGHGLIWVRLQADADDPGLPCFAAEDDARLRKVLCGPYDVAASAPRIVENFLDMSHFGFVHTGILGDLAHTETPPYQVSVDAQGVQVRDVRAWQPQSNRLSAEGSWVSYGYDVPAPYTAVLTKAPDAQAGYSESIALFVCPVEPERSRVWVRLAVPDFASTDEQLRAFQDGIFMQDAPIVESQRPRLLPITDAVVREVHSAADRSSTAYRRYLREQGITFGVC